MLYYNKPTNNNMKNLKSNLSQLQVKSFVTSYSETGKGTVKGGINWTNPWICTAACTVNPNYCPKTESPICI